MKFIQKLTRTNNFLFVIVFIEFLRDELLTASPYLYCIIIFEMSRGYFLDVL